MSETAKSEPTTLHEAFNARFKQMNLAIAEVARKLGATDADLHENWPDLFPEALSESAARPAVADASAKPLPGAGGSTAATSDTLASSEPNADPSPAGAVYAPEVAEVMAIAEQRFAENERLKREIARLQARTIDNAEWMPRLLAAHDFAVYPQTLDGWVKNDWVRSKKIGGSVYVSASDILARQRLKGMKRAQV